MSGLKPRPNATKEIPVIGPVANFALTNQDGRTLTLADLRGHVWIADIIFTLCPGPCPRMTRQMAELQTALPAGSTAKLVTITTDPEHDTPEVLKKYPGRLGLEARPHWMFLTGTKKEIAGLASGSLKLGITEIEPGKRTSDDDLFIHSTYFVVVDKQARLRAVFDTVSEGVEWTNVLSNIIATVEQLERER
jgi:protein SCO1/2